MKEQSISFPLTNAEFPKVISNSFFRFLQKGTSRSTDKLKPLHGAIARDLHRRLGRDYEIISQGYGVNIPNLVLKLNLIIDKVYHTIMAQ